MLERIERAAEVQTGANPRTHAKSAGRIMQVFERLRDRLPDVIAYTEAGRKHRGQVSIKFSDGYGSYTISPRSRDLAIRISADGSAAVGDQLAGEFLMLNSAAWAIFRGGLHGWIESWLAEDGEKRPQPRRHIGDASWVRIAQITFSPDAAVTSAIKNVGVEASIESLFITRPDFSRDCLAALSNPKPEVGLPDADLAPVDVPPAPDLLTLNAKLIEEMDRFAERTIIGEFFSQQSTIWKYSDRDILPVTRFRGSV